MNIEFPVSRYKVSPNRVPWSGIMSPQILFLNSLSHCRNKCFSVRKQIKTLGITLTWHTTCSYSQYGYFYSVFLIKLRWDYAKSAFIVPLLMNRSHREQNWRHNSLALVANSHSLTLCSNSNLMTYKITFQLLHIQQSACLRFKIDYHLTARMKRDSVIFRNFVKLLFGLGFQDTCCGLSLTQCLKKFLFL